MEMNIGYVDLAVVLIYLVGILLVGLWAGAKTEDLKDYAIANKVYGVPILLMTVIATDIGSHAIMGTSTQIYKDGAIALFSILFAEILRCWIASKFLFNRMNARFDGMISAADIIDRYYGASAKMISSLAATISGIGVAGVQIMALGTATSLLVGVPSSQGVIIGGGITVLYASLGGIRAVSITDAVQFILLISVLPLVASITMYNTGFKEIIFSLPEDNLRIIDHPNGWMYICIIIRTLCMCGLFHPSIVQRFLMAQDKKQISKVFRYKIVSDFILYLVVFFIVIAIMTQIDVSDPESVIFVAINSFLPPFVKGLGVVAVLAVLMSTIDSELNSAGILALHNIFRPFFRGGIIPRELLLVRAITLVGGILSIYFALNNEDVFVTGIYATTVWSLIGSTPICAVILGLRVFPILFWFNAFVMAFVFLFMKYAIGITTFATVSICPVVSIITCLLSIYIYNKGDIWDPEAFTPEADEFMDSRERDQVQRPLKERILECLSPSHLSNVIRESVVLTRNEPMIICSFICVLYTVPFFMWNYHDPKLYPEMVGFRLLSASLASVVFFKTYWTPFAKRYFAHYWYFHSFLCSRDIHPHTCCFVSFRTLCGYATVQLRSRY